MKLISEGSLVRLKSGGPSMVVRGTNDRGEFICCWFEGETPKEMPCPEFLLESLEQDGSGNSEDTTQRLPRAVVDLDARIDSLEKKVDARGYDTRPIFEAHEQKLAQLQQELQSLKGAQSPSAARASRIREAYENEELVTVLWKSKQLPGSIPEADCRIIECTDTYAVFQVSHGSPWSGDYERMSLSKNPMTNQLQVEIQG